MGAHTCRAARRAVSGDHARAEVRRVIERIAQPTASTSSTTIRSPARSTHPPTAPSGYPRWSPCTVRSTTICIRITVFRRRGRPDRHQRPATRVGAGPELGWASSQCAARRRVAIPRRQRRLCAVPWPVRLYKGAHLALRAAHHVGIPLVLAGKCNEPPEQAYFNEQVRRCSPRMIMSMDKSTR